MIKIIKQLKINDFYEIDINYNKDELFKVLTYVNKNTDNYSDFKFIKRNPDCIGAYISLVDYQEFLYLYEEYNFLENYMNEKLINLVINKSFKRLQIKFMNNEFFSNELINMDNRVNMEFNFYLFKKRLLEFNKLFPAINFNDFYIGQDMILYLTNNNLYKKNIDCCLEIFSIKNKINFTDTKNIYFWNDKLIYKNDKIKIIIDKTIIDPKTILFRKQKMFYDQNHIWCFPDFYQSFLTYKINDFDIPSISQYTFLSWKLNESSKHIFTNLKKCYNCKKYFDDDVILDNYIDFCLNCAFFYYENKILTCDLNNKYALITGIRKKIGLQVALKLLRCGCTVIGI